ncbi:MAG: hypothetical protein DRJ09_12030 [Bacteroidetes bacterium]|nr:MAG: hypothetical protein DRJ09_12030 [Bacteroidota bacterium]
MGFADGATLSTPDSLLLRYQSAPNDSVKNKMLRLLINCWKEKDLDSCIIYSKKIVDLAKKTNRPYNAYRGLFWLANCYASMGKNDSASFYVYSGYFF